MVNDEKIQIKFVINLDQKIDNSEQYINKSVVSKKSKFTIGEILISSISKYLLLNNFENKIDVQSNHFDLYWTEFINQVNKYNYKLQAVKSLRKWNKKIKNLNKGESIKNVAIIITSDNENLTYNSLVFYVNIENPETENSPIKVWLRRIEYDNFNFNNSGSISIELGDYGDQNYEYNPDESGNWRLVLDNLKDIFDNEDYNGDKLRLEEWEEILKEMRNAFNDKSESQRDNFISLYKDQLFLFSKQDVKLNQTYNLYDKNTGETIDGFEFNKQKLNNEFLKDLDDEVEKEEKNITNSNDKIKNIKLENEKSKRDLSSLFEQLKKLNNQHNEKATELDLYKNQINDFNKKNIDKKHQKIKVETNEKISKIKSLKDNTQKSINDIVKKIKTLEVDLSNKKQKIDDNNNEIEKLKNDIDKIKNKTLYYKELKIDLENNYKYIYKFNASYEKDLDIPDILDESSKKHRNLYFESKDKGTIAKINRYYNALLNLRQGYYKNPYFFEAIKNPENIFINEIKTINNEIRDKYHLNKKQICAVNKAINTNSICFIQGPPGTGKTQTICSIAEWVLKNDMNLVMTSSTHEAINNFFDRLNDYNYDNPNIIFYKYKFYKKDNKTKEEFDESTLFHKFKSKIINYVLPRVNNTSKLEQLISEYESEYKNVYPDDYINFLPKAIIEFIFENWENQTFTKKFCTNVQEKIFHPPIHNYFESMSDQLESILYKKSSKNKQNELFNQLIEEYVKLFKINKYPIEEFFYSFDKKLFQEINNFIRKQKSYNNDKLVELLEKIKTKYENQEDHKYENQFLEYIKLHKLVNVIGITTSSNNKIELNGEEITLYDEYPIDYIIIDEISKCSTPEIISKAVLSKKCLFVGDYLQLPPSSDLDSDVIVNHLKSNYKKYIDDKSTNDDIKKDITNLFKNSFFVIQKDKIVESSKSVSAKNKPYEFLNESHRFGKEIMKLVNKIYDKKEQLISPENFKFESKTYGLKINNQNLDNPAVLINLKEPTSEFKKYHNINESFFRKIDELGFDQNYFIELKGNTERPDITGDGSFNQHSAFVTLSIINKLIKQNQNKIEEKGIAIITLTRNQKIIIKYYLDNCLLFKDIKKYVKVDTIDNFQGREADIVFVDFIRGERKYTESGLVKIRKRNVDFLSEKERINVAISRAKQKLILIGYFDYLKTLKSENCVYFLDYYEELNDSNNSYIEWNGARYEK